MEFKLADRLNNLQPYLFAEIDKKKIDLRKKGIDFIDLSIGDPDIPAPPKVVNILGKQAKLKENQKYALDAGKFNLKKSISKWMKWRFKVCLSPQEEVLPLIGSKEGLVHFPLAFVNQGEYIIIPSPAYPGYIGAAVFSGAKIFRLPLLKENNFLPDFKKIPPSVRNKAKLIYLNYPNNPTTVVAPYDFLIEAVKFCRKYGIIIAYDNAYSEIYFDMKPHSILEVPQAREIALEFHSLSKTFCMTGFRIGWACGNKNLVKGLLKVKTNIDSGIFGAIQDAAVAALDGARSYPQQLRKIFKERRDILSKELIKRGYFKFYCEATFYVWIKIPSSFSSLEFSQYLLDKNIVATPGIGFGEYGEGYIRFALTVDKKHLREVGRLLK